MDSSPQPEAIVVNDDRIQLRLLADLIAKDGFRVRAFERGDDALQAAVDGAPPDIVVTDLHMPGIDGWRLCRLLRSPEYSRLNDVPVLVISATFAGADVEQITRESGADAFLPAPFTPEDLRDQVHGLLNGGAPRRRSTVLVVEDCPVQARLVERAFQARGYATRVASTGESGRCMFREHPAHIAVLDLHLPDASGRDLLRDFKHRDSSVVAVVTTADATPHLATDLMRAGADGYVRKPFEPQYLIDLCERAARERALLHVEELLEERTVALRQSEAYHRSLIENAMDGIAVLNRRGIIRYLSPGAERLLRCSSSDGVGRHAARFIHPGDLPELSREFADASGSGGGSWTREFHLRSGADDQWRSVEGIGKSLLGDPAVRGVVVNFHDVTEEREAQRQLAAQNRLAAVGQLAAGIAHDFNNLLTGIVGYAGLLQADEDVPQAAKKRLKAIEDQGQRAAKLIRQILDFSRKSISRRRVLNLVPVVRDVGRLLRRTIEENITVAVRMPSDECLAKVDLAQVQQVVTNLTLNARDAMPDGGELRLSLEPFVLSPQGACPVSGMVPGPWALLAVADTGRGMSAEIRDHVFEPFFTTKDVGEGSGLGLAQVYGIVRKHEGFVDIASEPGRGTTVSVYLPLVSEPAKRTADGTRDSLQVGQGETILLVEDEGQVLKVVGQMLSALNYRALPATDGKHALEVFAEHRSEIDLVLTDMMMPKLGGVELVRRLRAQVPGLTAVVLTGYAPKDEAELKRDGIAEWVQKPPTLGTLGAALERALRGRRD